MEDRQFLVRNIIKGFIWLFLIVAGYLIVKRYVNIDYFKWFEPFFDQKILIFIVFTLSEIIIGLIPPEFFAMWALRFDSLNTYIIILILLSVISYFAGITGFFIGRYFNNTKLYKYILKHYLYKIKNHLHNFGGVLIVIASLTPVPFSGVAMLMGSIEYRFNKYILYSTTRFIKYAIIGWVFWETQYIA